MAHGVTIGCSFILGALITNFDSFSSMLDRIRPVEARFQAISACQFHGMSSSMRLIL